MEKLLKKNFNQSLEFKFFKVKYVLYKNQG